MLKDSIENTANGISLIAANGTAKKVITIIDNKPRKAYRHYPYANSRRITLEITTQYNGGENGLKVPRTGTFNKILTVI